MEIARDEISLAIVTDGQNGQTYYTWIKYADSPTSGMSDNPSGKAYIGIAYNKTSATESSTYSDYTWSKIKGETGSDGNGIATVTQYYARTTTFTKPSADSITATTPPALDNTYKYLWLKEVISFTKTTSQTMITLIAARGENGEMSAEQIAQLNKAAQDASAAVSTANTANTKVNNLQIGGRNLALTSQFLDSTILVNTSGTNKCVETATYSDRKSIKLTGENTANAMTFYFKTPYQITLNNGVIVNCDMPADKYQYSFDTKNSGVKTLNSFQLRLFKNGVNAGVILTTQNHIRVTTTGNESEWTRVNGSFDVEISASASNTLTGTYDIYVGYVNPIGQAFELSLFKFEKGDKPTDWTPAPEDVQGNIDGVQNNLNNLEVGGVNLLRNTGNLDEWARTAYMANAVFNGSEIKYPPESVVSGSSQTWNASIHMYPKIEYNLVKDRKVTVSFYARVDTTNSDTSQSIQCVLSRSSTAGKNATRSKYRTFLTVTANKLTTSWQRFTATVTVNDAFFTSGTAGTNDIYVFLQLYNHTLSEVYVKNIQLEYGDKATSWTPAPEDIQEHIDNIEKHLVFANDSVNIVGDDNVIYSKYGETTQIGAASNSHINVVPSGIDFYAKWSSSAVKVASFKYQQAGAFSGFYLDGGNMMTLNAGKYFAISTTSGNDISINGVPFYQDLAGGRTTSELRTLVTGHSKVSIRRAYRNFNTVSLYLRVSGSLSLASGGEIEGKFEYSDDTVANTYTKPEWLPIESAHGVGYYSSRVIVMLLRSDGTYVIRNTGTSISLGSSDTMILTITYVI